MPPPALTGDPGTAPPAAGLPVLIQAAELAIRGWIKAGVREGPIKQGVSFPPLPQPCCPLQAVSSSFGLGHTALQRPQDFQLGAAVSPASPRVVLVVVDAARGERSQLLFWGWYPNIRGSRGSSVPSGMRSSNWTCSGHSGIARNHFLPLPPVQAQASLVARTPQTRLSSTDKGTILTSLWTPSPERHQWEPWRRPLSKPEVSTWASPGSSFTQRPQCQPPWLGLL
ncbi:uncharacterized protein LOC112548081 [Alligator sinensis]|uniref:Uncharacterized protein LOC112548081 n=1 Tax=Alligator sinensis TaxID=38654 RepID=A0A3Q0FPQ1_ALLSI|nr:uncharacterized protein LOC112548081 [Alligator sinensis]